MRSFSALGLFVFTTLFLSLLALRNDHGDYNMSIKVYQGLCSPLKAVRAALPLKTSALMLEHGLEEG